MRTSILLALHKHNEHFAPSFCMSAFFSINMQQHNEKGQMSMSLRKLIFASYKFRIFINFHHIWPRGWKQATPLVPYITLHYSPSVNQNCARSHYSCHYRDCDLCCTIISRAAFPCSFTFMGCCGLFIFS